MESHRASALRPLKQSFTANIVRYAIPNNLFELQGKCAQRVRHDIKRVEGACLFSYYWRRRLAGVASEGVYMLQAVQLLAGTSFFLLAFSVLIFDIPRYTLTLVSLSLVRLLETY